VEAACWVHARRPFFVLADVAANARAKAQGKTAGAISPIALEAVRRIDALFAIERAINGQSAERRRAVRQELSAPLLANLHAWLREQRATATIWPRRWTTCSSAGRRSLASSTTAAFASRTMPLNEPCAASPWAGSHGCSLAPTAVGSGPQRCTA
jgi:hypothetical protein